MPRGAPAYSYVNKERCEELVTYSLVTDPAIVREAGEIALASYGRLSAGTPGGWTSGRTPREAQLHRDEPPAGP